MNNFTNSTIVGFVFVIRSILIGKKNDFVQVVGIL